MGITEQTRALRAEADALMDGGTPERAAACYAAAWAGVDLESLEGDDWNDVLWLLLSRVDALVAAGRHGEAYEVVGASFELLGGGLVGNPFFHLRMGQCKYALMQEDERGAPGPGGAIDELARALIGGGVELFDGEDPGTLELVTSALEPPVGCATWQESRGTGGATQSALNGSNGYLRGLFSARFGAPPPYAGAEEVDLEALAEGPPEVVREMVATILSGLKDVRPEDELPLFAEACLVVITRQDEANAAGQPLDTAAVADELVECGFPETLAAAIVAAVVELRCS